MTGTIPKGVSPVKDGSAETDDNEEHLLPKNVNRGVDKSIIGAYTPNMRSQPTQSELAKCTECACFNIRKASRAVTQLYDEMLQSSGLRVTQFTLLVVLARAGSITITRLGQRLVMDRTTMTRNLKPLANQGLITIESGQDQRTRIVTLTASGREALAKAFPLWEKAQTHVVERLGRKRWSILLSDLSATVTLARLE
jgi:DNA-binding MarR family transcriptional regulator